MHIYLYIYSCIVALTAQVGASVVTLREKDTNADAAGGLTSLPSLRREPDQVLRKQQSLVQTSMGHQSETNVPTSRNLHGTSGSTGGTQQMAEKRSSAVLLQRASSVAVRSVGEENAPEEDNLRSGLGGPHDADSGQPEWLRLAQKKREKRELKEKMMDNNGSVAANNAMNTQDTNAPNNKQASNQQDVSDISEIFSKGRLRFRRR